MKVIKFISNNLFASAMLLLLLIVVIFKLLPSSESGITLFLLMVLIFARDFLNFRKYWKLLTSSNSAIINKNQYSITMTTFPVFVLILVDEFNDIYTYLSLAFSFGIMILHLITRRRRMIVFHQNEIEDFNDSLATKPTDQITSFNIYENNLEIIFNGTEILQINKHELSIPDWDVFAKRMEEFKESLPNESGLIES